ncbi:MAG: hypothetical protein OXC11_14245 [Rhodospirillales bacterium]|nr:hypothetical protein [Rhodospirillales bacterium]
MTATATRAINYKQGRREGWLAASQALARAAPDNVSSRRPRGSIEFIRGWYEGYDACQSHCAEVRAEHARICR